ncbi:hypothetical protein AB6A40_005003 [Gnathostoma spinigerum]|uniref:Retinol dehydrogenase 14 n=1 Tax=Gnathostoma spinigerum TaxID=75299 RepID=A0ABD6EJG5_9BILA
MCTPKDQSVSSSWTVTIPVFSVLSLILYLLRLFMKGAKFEEKATASATGKIALVTNATSSFGIETIKALNFHGAVVHMICGNFEHGNVVRYTLENDGCDSSRLIVKCVDLRDLEQIREFAERFRNEVGKLDILVDNTDVVLNPNIGNPMNSLRKPELGHFLLNQLMIPLLKKSENGRIVVVSSRIVDEEFLGENKKNESLCTRSYRVAKVANSMYARELSRRLREEDPTCNIVVNSCYPGLLYSTVMANSFLTGRSWLRTLVSPFIWFCTKSLTDGIQTALFLALSKSVKHISGKYFEECSEKTTFVKATNDEVNRSIYDNYLKAVGLIH